MTTQLQLVQTRARKGREKAQRKALDFYETPAWMTRALLDNAPEVRGDRLCIPCCGRGRMAAQLLGAGRFADVVVNEPHAARMADAQALLGPWVVGAHQLDAQRPETWAALGPCDWVVDNPPFNAASVIVPLALERARRGVAMLLRCTFLEPVEARQWLVRLPPTRVLSLSRDSFTGKGQDSAPAWWMIWERDGAGYKQGGVTVVRADEVLQEGLKL